MKKISSKKLLGSVLLLFIALFTNCVFSSAIDKEPQLLIDNFWGRVGFNNEWCELLSTKIKDEYVQFAENRTNKESFAGILAVKKANIVKIYNADETEVPNYPELAMYKNRLFYRVVVNLDTYRENDYFKNGINEYYMTLVNDGTGYKVGSISKRYLQYQDKAGWGFAQPGAEPTTINVMDQNGNIHYSEAMRDFVFNVVCNEIGNLGYEIDAIKSNIVVVKMAGWWAKRMGYRAALGCDIKYGDVTYMNYNSASETNQKYIENCMYSVFNYSMFANNGQVFYAAYFAGSRNAAGQSSGQLRQNGSDYLAMNGYTWREILHYYFDNSAYNNPNTGRVVIE